MVVTGADDSLGFEPNTDAGASTLLFSAAGAPKTDVGPAVQGLFSAFDAPSLLEAEAAEAEPKTAPPLPPPKMLAPATGTAGGVATGGFLNRFEFAKKLGTAEPAFVSFSESFDASGVGGTRAMVGGTVKAETGEGLAPKENGSDAIGASSPSVISCFFGVSCTTCKESVHR